MIAPISQMRKVRHRDVEYLSPDLAAGIFILICNTGQYFATVFL